MFSDLKKDLEASAASAKFNFIDSPASRSKGKVFFRNRELHDFACFDVLGLAQDKRVKRAAQEAIEASAVSSPASRKSAGTSSWHLIAEKSLASFFGCERALLFSSRNQVVFSVLATLLKEQDIVYCDEDCAGLLADVCLLINCQLEVVDLSELKKFENLLAVPPLGRRRLVFADSVSQSSARKLDLLGLSALCARNNLLLLVDESSAAGVLGPRGAGVSDEAALSKSPTRPFAVISELGLGLGIYGACLCGPKLLIEALGARSKTLATEPSYPPHLAACLVNALDICELSFAQRALIKGKAEYLLGELLQIERRLRIAQSSFLSLSFDKAASAARFTEHLFAKGFWVDTVPSSSKFSQSVLVRVVPSSWHDDSVLAELLRACEEFFAVAK